MLITGTGKRKLDIHYVLSSRYLSHCPLGSLSDEAFVGLLGLDTLYVQQAKDTCL